MSYFSGDPVVFILSPPLQFAGDKGPGSDSNKAAVDLKR